MMDRVLGILLTALGRDLENPLRRKAYGRPGEYRLPAAGALEYRTPGAFVLSSPQIFNFALDLGRASVQLGCTFDPETFFLPGARDIIVNCDADVAVARIKKFEPFFKAMLSRCGYKPEAALDILYKGAKAAGLPLDVISAWQLKDDSWLGHNCNDTNSFTAFCYKYASTPIPVKT